MSNLKVNTIQNASGNSALDLSSNGLVKTPVSGQVWLDSMYSAAGEKIATTSQGHFELAPGSATTPVMDFDPTGVLLTTPITGAWEYASTSPLLFTPKGLERGVVQAAQTYILNAARTGPTATGTFSLLGVGCNLAANTRYLYDIDFTITKTSTNAAAIQYAAAVTSGTITSHAYEVIAATAAAALTPAAAQMMSNYITTGFATLVTATVASAAAASAHSVKIRGAVDVGGTAIVGFNPQIGFSAAPTTSSIQAGASMAIWPVGPSGANINYGTWA